LEPGPPDIARVLGLRLFEGIPSGNKKSLADQGLDRVCDLTERDRRPSLSSKTGIAITSVLRIPLALEGKGSIDMLQVFRVVCGRIQDKPFGWGDLFHHHMLLACSSRCSTIFNALPAGPIAPS